MHRPIHLDRTRDEPQQNQLFEQLRGLIVAGTLKPNSRIIATRFLSEQMKVSRTTVLLAYERLIAEGYLETRPAVGTFVCETLPASGTEPGGLLRFAAEQGAGAPPVQRRHPTIDFALSPDNRYFPYKSWQKITQTVMDGQARHPEPIDDHPHGCGLMPLRSVIAEWLAFHRGIIADPEQVVVVSGKQQALAICATLVGLARRTAVVEAPGDPHAAELFNSFGARLRFCPVDDQGLGVGLLPEEPVALLHVTPSRQRPLGMTLPLERREALLAWAQRSGAILLEDDSDGDFRYQGSAQPSLYSLDPQGCVIYLRSFSETMSPGLRLVYMVVPRDMAEAARRVKACLDSGTPWFEQRVLTEFIASGEYDRHLRVARRALLERRDALIDRLRRHFADARLIGTSAGSHVSWQLPESLGSAERAQQIAALQGINVYRPLSGNAASRRNDLLLGYGALEVADIHRGVDRLAELLRGSQDEDSAFARGLAAAG